MAYSIARGESRRKRSVGTGAYKERFRTVTRSCGHSEGAYVPKDVAKAGGKQLTDAAKDVRAEAYAGWFEEQATKLCKECYIEAAHAADDVFDTRWEMLDLWGSPAQVAWARSIRRQFLTECIDANGDMTANFVTLAGQLSARWWISRRRTTLAEILEDFAARSAPVDGEAETTWLNDSALAVA